MLKEYIIEVFEPTLLFGLLCSLVGLSAAIYYGHSSIYLGIIAIIGVITTQIAVNLIDDYVDYNVGIDKETKKTKFSGGSELIASKKLSTRGILGIAIMALFISLLIGIYILQFLSIYVIGAMIGLILFGGIVTIFYAKYLTHVPYFSEPLVTIAFAMVGLGVFIVATNSIVNSYFVFLFVCIPSGLQVGVAMIANELPDKEVDKKYGRRNIIIMLSENKKASGLYFLFQGMGYLLIGYGIIEHILPITFLIMFTLIPLMYIIGTNIEKYKNPKQHEKTMGLNALAAFSYIFFISLAFII